MSYSFTILADSKDDAKEQVADSFKKIVGDQPDHKRDAKAVEAAAGAFIDLLDDPGDKRVRVEVVGSLSLLSDKVFRADCRIATSLIAPEPTL